MSEREVRYCTTEDGVRIAYSVEGEGPTIISPGSINSFTAPPLNEAFLAFNRSLGHGRKLVMIDGRGVGLSDRDPADLSHHGHVMDIEAVIAELDSSVTLLGDGLTGPAAIECAARHPDRVSKLVLYGTCARLADQFDRGVVESMATMARQNYDLMIQMITVVDPADRVDNPDIEKKHIEVITASMTSDAMSRYLLEGYDSDVTHLLPRVAVPTLVLHRLDDAFIRFELGRQVYEAIPGAKFIPLSGASHQLYAGDWVPAAEAINRFLDDGAGRIYTPAQSHTPDTLKTILFTDLVGHTAMMSRLGDDAGRAVLREHEDITRKVLKDHGGTEVKTMGDGFMASFASVTKAVECAIALQRAFTVRDGEPLSVRVGLNAGEPIEEDGDLFGATVILASRIAARAEGGEILVSDNVRSLCSGKNFLVADRGDFAAKGIEEPVRIYEVSWRHS